MRHTSVKSFEICTCKWVLTHSDNLMFWLIRSVKVTREVECNLVAADVDCILMSCCHHCEKRRHSFHTTRGMRRRQGLSSARTPSINPKSSAQSESRHVGRSCSSSILQCGCPLPFEIIVNNACASRGLSCQKTTAIVRPRVRSHQNPHSARLGIMLLVQSADNQSARRRIANLHGDLQLIDLPLDVTNAAPNDANGMVHQKARIFHSISLPW